MYDYGNYRYHREQFNVGDLLPEEVEEVCLDSASTGPGLDGWHGSDSHYLSPKAYTYITNICNNIEKGDHWPKHFETIRSVFLSKTRTRLMTQWHTGPLRYIIWYRKRATCRLRTLTPWIEEWDCPELNARVPGKSAQDAWYKSAMSR